MKQPFSIDVLIERIEAHINIQCPDGANVPIDTLQLLATLNVAKQTERQVDALNGIRAAIEQAGINVGKHKDVSELFSARFPNVKQDKQADESMSCHHIWAVKGVRFSEGKIFSHYRTCAFAKKT